MNYNAKVIIEKYKKWDYINSQGFYVWTNRYGDIIEIKDEFGNLKNKYGVTMEMMQDLNSFHAIDAVAELTALLTQELAVEIDRNIIQDLMRMGNGNF